MTALTVIGVIFLLLLLLVCIPVRLHIAYSGQTFRLHLYLLFLRFDLSPDKLLQKLEQRGEKPQKKKKEKKAEPGTEAAEEDEPKKKKKKLGMEDIKPLWLASRRALNLVRRHFILYQVRVNAAISRPDAHQTALAYAKTSAFLSVLLSILGELFVLKPARVHVSPDFTKDKSNWDISLRLRIRPVFVLAAAVCLLAGIIKAMRRAPAARVKTNRKGGQTHESAAAPH